MPQLIATLAGGRVVALALLIAVPGSVVALHSSRPAPIAPDSLRAPVAAYLDSAIAQEMRDKSIPALSLAIVDGDRIVWARGFGAADSAHHAPATAHTVYPVAGVSALVTDLAMMQLAEQGRVDLDAPVTRYLTGLHPRNPFRTPITLRQLASHTAGLVREAPVGNVFDTTARSLASTVASLDSTTLAYAPATRVKYSSAGVATIGYVVERVSREPFAAYVAQHVLAPLGMEHSAFAPAPALEPQLATGYLWSYDGRRISAPRVALGESPATSLYTTAEDLGRFMGAIFAGGQGAHGRVVSASTLESMWAPPSAPAGMRDRYGIGFETASLDGVREVGANGAIDGVTTTLEMLPSERLGVVVIATLDGANGVTMRIATAALRAMLAERRHLPPPPWVTTTAVAATDAARLAGWYTSRGSALELSYLTAPSDSLRAARLVIRDAAGGTRGVLRQRGDTLVRDGRLGFGTRFLSRGDTLIASGQRFVRARLAKPAAARPSLRRLVGEYGWDHSVLYVLEDRGRLEALSERLVQSPLTRITDSAFTFPTGSPFEGEPVTFAFDGSGAVTGLHLGKIWFPRRAIGPASGNQLRVTPVRPIAELEREARAATPPVESRRLRAPDLVELVSLDSTIHLEIRYATTHNFLGTRFYPAARAFLQRPAAEALVRAHRQLEKLGYGILVHDSYRPWYVTRMFWDAVPEDKKIFVADPSEGSRHNRGAAADVSLYDLATGAPVDMVSTYDETSDRAYANYAGGTSLQRWHRALLRRALEAEGFRVYYAEWWHFDYEGWQDYPVLNIPYEQIHSGNPAVR